MQARQASKTFIMITVFLDVMGMGLVIPVLPALVGQLAGSQEMQATWYGIIMATYGTMQFCCAPALGALSDRFGRRPILLLSIFGLGTSFLVTGMATSLITLWLIRLLSGATGASFSVAGAYMADISPPEERGKAFGMIGAAFGMGFVFGPMLGGLLGQHGLRLPFLAAASMSMINWLYGYFVLPESLPKEKRSPFSLRRANPFTALANLSKLEGVGGLIGVFALTVLAQLILQSTWVLYTTFRFHWTPQDNGIALFVVGIVSAIVQGGLQGPLLKRFGEKRLALMGLTSGAIAFFFYGTVREGWMMYCIIFANMLGFAAGPALQAIVSKQVDPTKQGITMGSLNAINSVMMVVAPLLGSRTLAWVSNLPPSDWRFGTTFYVACGLQICGLVLATIHFRRQRNERLAAAAATSK